MGKDSDENGVYKFDPKTRVSPQSGDVADCGLVVSVNPNR
jgi:hypothetical protein